MLVRLWMRARLSEAQNWQANHDHPFFYAGPAKCARVAAWKQAARAELAACRARKASHPANEDDQHGWAMVLLDLVKAFDHVSHEALLAQAELVGYLSG